MKAQFANQNQSRETKVLTSLLRTTNSLGQSGHIVHQTGAALVVLLEAGVFESPEIEHERFEQRPFETIHEKSIGIDFDGLVQWIRLPLWFRTAGRVVDDVVPIVLLLRLEGYHQRGLVDRVAFDVLGPPHIVLILPTEQAGNLHFPGRIRCHTLIDAFVPFLVRVYYQRWLLVHCDKTVSKQFTVAIP